MKKVIITMYIDGENIVGYEAEETDFVKETEVEVEREESISRYARIFDAENPNWRDDPLDNQIFLSKVQNECNFRLREKKYLLLNEVYELLGIPATGLGEIVGWIHTKDSTKKNWVDFFCANAECNQRFLDGEEKMALLDFNVDGIIVDRLGEI